MREGFTIRAQIIWAKERLVIGRGDYHWQHEPCWYAVRTKGHRIGDRPFLSVRPNLAPSRSANGIVLSANSLRFD